MQTTAQIQADARAPYAKAIATLVDACNAAIATMTQPVWTGEKHSMSAATIMRGDARRAVDVLREALSRVNA